MTAQNCGSAKLLFVREAPTNYCNVTNMKSLLFLGGHWKEQNEAAKELFLPPLLPTLNPAEPGKREMRNFQGRQRGSK